MPSPFDIESFAQQLFAGPVSFDRLSERLWQYQMLHNPVIARYCELLKDNRQTFIPISFFKEFVLKTGQDWEAEAVFESSGTTGQIPSRHYICDLDVYHQSLTQGFHLFFENQRYRILALVPEREHSSLVHMVKMWIAQFGLPGSGFFISDFEGLSKGIAEARSAKEPILMIGVAYALLDFAEQASVRLPENAIVLETGGMKGRQQELIREDLHERLCQNLKVPFIGSEYGMTELLSQFYALRNGRFQAPPWAKVWISDIHLPDLPVPEGATGRINIIDLANIHSCAFISTDDVGREHPDGTFEVLGRLDYAEMRGCSLMYG